MANRTSWNKGKRWSKESKLKMSLAHKGKIPWNKGKKCAPSPFRNGKTFNCQTCDTEFYRAAWQIRKGPQKFCSLTCRRHTPETKLKCSKSRMGKLVWNRGKTKYDDPRLDFYRPTAFKDQGKSEANMLLRKSTLMRWWRASVFKRDDYTCQGCGARGGRLNADHILPFSTHPELRFELGNGRTLCVDCHKKTPTYARGALKFASTIHEP